MLAIVCVLISVACACTGHPWCAYGFMSAALVCEIIEQFRD